MGGKGGVAKKSALHKRDHGVRARAMCKFQAQQLWVWYKASRAGRGRAVGRVCGGRQ